MKRLGFLFSFVIVIGCLANKNSYAQSGAAPTVPPLPAGQPVQVTQPAPPPSLDQFLAFDAETKDYHAKAGEAQAAFTFSLTNISSDNVTINFVQTSCGCTVAKLPATPWVLTPGSNGEIHVTMNLAGKSGRVTKTLTVNSDKGSKQLLVNSIIEPAPPVAVASTNMPNMPDKLVMQSVAAADRQAVFKGDCASCHVEKAKDKIGKELFATACGICHEAEHRASMVPDLHALNKPVDANYWKSWITYGRPGSLMPAFAQSEGGFLNEAQIASLVSYLSIAIPSKPVLAPAPTAAH
jgi:mono/diheme cytochrome c family protein